MAWICGNVHGMSQETATRDDEAQRTLERKALRNVRGLVDKLEGEQRGQSRTTARFVAASIAVALAAAGAVYFVMVGGGKKASAPVTSSTPARPAPPAR